MSTIKNVYLFIAKIVKRAGYDYQTDPELTLHERSYIEQGIRELEFYNASDIPRYWGSSDGQTEGIQESNHSPEAEDRGVSEGSVERVHAAGRPKGNRAGIKGRPPNVKVANGANG